jgi:hypothetical protein
MYHYVPTSCPSFKAIHLVSRIGCVAECMALPFWVALSISARSR